MNLAKKIQLNEFMKDNPFMSIKPSNIDGLVIEGKFSFTTQYKGYPKIDTTYKLKITILNNFPFEIPEVVEIEAKIPRDGMHHVNPAPENSLCLGSSIKLLELLRKEPTLNGFVKFCLVPFLYAVSLKIEHEIDFIFGELAHGVNGIINDYIQIFGVTSEDEVKNVLYMLTLNKRVANKRPCPCKCGQRLGKCSLRLKINEYRKLAPRSWYAKHKLVLDNMR